MRPQWPHVRSLGFTGTRQGMTAWQKAQLWEMVHLAVAVGTAFHHGDCVGSDAEAHALAIQADLRCHIHPPSSTTWRAWCTGGVVYAPKRYLERNQVIVRTCDVLIAAPRSLEEERRSGTWHTVRYARYCGKPVVLLAPEDAASVGVHT